MLAGETIAAAVPVTGEVGRAVATGLRGSPKRLPCWLLYDERGSMIYEEITVQPEYYLTRIERAILDAHAGAMLQMAGPPLAVAELGAGSADKTRLILRELCARQDRATFYPVDVSPALAASAARLRAAFPALEVVPIGARYPDEIGWLQEIEGRRLLLFLGSSIGNLAPPEAAALLGTLREELAAGDALLLGTDLVKAPELLLRAYDDPAGVTARFSRNVLARINRELGGCFDLGAFRHVARWNAQDARVEIYLESRRAQAVPIGALGMEVELEAGELIHIEDSHKFTLEGIERLLEAAGFEPEGAWVDAYGWCAVHLARA